jgi:hypothetical protein
MKLLLLILLLGLAMPGCSRWTKSGRQERAYAKYVKNMSSSRDKQRSKIIQQRAEVPTLRSSPPPEENVQVSESE